MGSRGWGEGELLSKTLFTPISYYYLCNIPVYNDKSLSVIALFYSSLCLAIGLQLCEWRATDTR